MNSYLLLDSCTILSPTEKAHLRKQLTIIETVNAVPVANRHAGMVCISILPPAMKRQVWAFIKAHRPQVLAMLTGTDPTSSVAALLKADPRVEIWLPRQDTGLDPPSSRSSTALSSTPESSGATP